jgi:hypothetical protein
MLEGELAVHTDTTTITLKPGDNFHIPLGVVPPVMSGLVGGCGLLVASPSNFTAALRGAPQRYGSQRL